MILVYMNKEDLVLNYLKWLIYHKTKPICIYLIYIYIYIYIYMNKEDLALNNLQWLIFMALLVGFGVLQHTMRKNFI